MKNLYTIALIITVSISASAQKKHYTIKTRVDSVLTYEPDTIPIWFKELIVDHRPLYKDDILIPHSDSLLVEVWQHGFVVWSTYKQVPMATYITSDSYMTFSNSNKNAYYKDEYRQSAQFIDGIFLYSDRKTRVKNHVIQTIKR